MSDSSSPSGSSSPVGLVENFLKALKPIEQSARWARERSAASPASHQELVREAGEDDARYAKAKAELEATLATQTGRAGWEPIATAPKDGSKFLLLHLDGTYCISYWGSVRGVFGWKSTAYEDHTFCVSIIGWMPLPPVPETKA